MQRIPVAGPWITEHEVEYVRDAAANAWYANANLWQTRFEKRFADYVGRRHAVALPSGTSAIHLALLALGIGVGDEVVVPDATWIASAAPISYVGAIPVFADVEPDTWCLSADSFAACVTPRTKAVIPVDLYGGMPDMRRILEVAQRYSIAVIEDAAEAIGSQYRGQKAGSFGDAGVFSFHGSKTLTTGEGGMLVTNRDALRDRVLVLRDHGRPPGDRMFFNTEVAWKYKMSAMQAALGVAQLERIDELVAKKRKIFSWYHERVGGLPEITLNAEPSGTLNSYWMVTVILPDRCGGKLAIMQALDAAGIDSRPFFSPLSSLPAYAHAAGRLETKERNAISYRLGAHGVNLPSALSLTEGEVDVVCVNLKRLIA